MADQEKPTNIPLPEVEEANVVSVNENGMLNVSLDKKPDQFDVVALQELVEQGTNVLLHYVDEDGDLQLLTSKDFQEARQDKEKGSIQFPSNIVGCFPKPNSQETIVFCMLENGDTYRVHVDGETARWHKLDLKFT